MQCAFLPGFLLCLLPFHTERVNVKCNQTGKIFKEKVSTLSREDLQEPLTAADFLRGSQLLMDINKKSYPVTVQKVVTLITDQSEGILSLG